MDLSAYSLQKLNREKRERQPNWTEPEKQLLLSLTRMHQSILENKGSDTMTIKRKSEAWDDIALRMKVAGYNRSKERLKQQLGRIRAAEAKKIKDAAEKDFTPELQLKDLSVLTNSSMSEEMDTQIEQSNTPTKLTLLPVSAQMLENHIIKIEKKASIDVNQCSQEDLQVISDAYNKPKLSSCIILNNLKNDSSGNNGNQVLDNMHFTFQNVQSLAETSNNITSEIANGCINDNSKEPAIISDINLPIRHYKKNEKVTAFSGVTRKNKSRMLQQQRRRLRRMRSNRLLCSSFKREQSLRQLYMYRIAVERERLRSLQVQQKRDRILYRKDIEIQNLKLQILRNLRNQNRSEANRINL